jgi:hypothetical protein
MGKRFPPRGVQSDAYNALEKRERRRPQSGAVGGVVGIEVA